MPISISGVLDVLAAHDIRPFEVELEDFELPGIGEIKDGETIYSTSISEVFEGDGEAMLHRPGFDFIDDPRMNAWWEEIDRIVNDANGATTRRSRDRPPEAPEPHCAWYCPIHYFGRGWGTYIRESCILELAIDIAAFVDWPSVCVAGTEIGRQLLRSAFYVLFLHEQFHHKVESLGLESIQDHM